MKTKKNRDTMKDRIAHIMRAKNLKASDFATLLGIQPSGISHILSGRNQPSLDFVKKIKETFPEYNLEWIIFGSGPMTTSEPFQMKPTSASDLQPDLLPIDEPALPSNNSEELFQPSSTPAKSSPNAIRSLVILYEDGTFETYQPR